MPFILGRPLGKPADAAFQHAVLDAALGLLARTDGPIFELYDQDAEDGVDEAHQAWSCPVTFGTLATQSLADRVRSEISLLAPWYDKGRGERGGTSLGVSGLTIEEIVDYIVQFEDPAADNSAKTDIDNAGDMLKHAAEDLKAFYNEAAVSQPGVSTATQLENWYWRETSAGELVKSARLACLDSKDASVKLTARFLLVPESQL